MSIVKQLRRILAIVNGGRYAAIYHRWEACPEACAGFDAEGSKHEVISATF
jgi:viroplasmin and RNaseH domain-containing protein